jgi:hypothetical protein
MFTMNFIAKLFVLKPSSMASTTKKHGNPPPPKKKGTKVEVRVRRYPGPSKLWHISNFAYTTKYYLNSAKGSGML